MHKILIVEDEEHLRTLLRDMLSFDGFAVIEACTGEEALALAETEAPDLAFVDIGLPGLSGWEVCRRLLASPTLKKIKIVVHTANTRGDVMPNVRDLGIDHFLLKPYDPIRVVTMLRTILGEA